MRQLSLLVTAWAALSLQPAGAQSWVESVLPERSYDFGTVARGSKVRHAFPLVNRTNQELRIATWKTKCGCTEVRVGAQVIPPGTQTTVEAVIDTTRFVGHKPSGLTLVFDQPTYTEIDLNVSCFILGELTLNPGGVDFGVVTRSAAEKPSVQLTLAYAGGQPNWGITRMQTGSEHLKASLQEQSRTPDGRVNYLLTATLDPSDLNGYFKDQITLFTNAGSQTIPISVTGQVQSSVTVSPSPLVIGPVKAGQTVTKTLLVRSSQPFKVTGVKPSKDDVTASPDDNTGPLHQVRVTFKAPARSGPYNAAIAIETDLKGEPAANITAFATVVP
jgi:hypothetical protein